MDALKGLARLLSTSEDDRYRAGADAVILAERACELTSGRDGEALEVLAAAYAESRRFRDAEELLIMLLKSVRQANQQSRVKELEQQLLLYRSNKPLREKRSFGSPRAER